jgi:hypothetical protein
MRNLGMEKFYARRKRWGLQDNDACAFCDQEQETVQHLAGECIFAREVWHRVLAPIGLDLLTPQPGISFLDWWLSRCLMLGSARRKGFDSLTILGSWCLWKEWNRRVFNGVGRSVVTVADSVVEEAVRWSQAGYGHLTALWVAIDGAWTSVVPSSQIQLSCNIALALQLAVFLLPG